MCTMSVAIAVKGDLNVLMNRNLKMAPVSETCAASHSVTKKINNEVAANGADFHKCRLPLAAQR